MTADERPTRSAEAGRVTLILDGADVPSEFADLVVAGATFKVHGTFTRMIAALLNEALSHRIADELGTGSLDGELLVETQQVESVTLDEIIERAEQQYRQWIEEHPDVDLDSPADEPAGRKYDAQRAIRGSVVPEDDDVLQRLALDPRVWAYEGEDPIGVSVPGAVAAAIEDLIALRFDEIKRPGASS